FGPTVIVRRSCQFGSIRSPEVARGPGGVAGSCPPARADVWWKDQAAAETPATRPVVAPRKPRRDNEVRGYAFMNPPRGQRSLSKAVAATGQAYHHRARTTISAASASHARSCA